MESRRKRYVFDACAVLAYYDNEAGFQVIKDIFESFALDECDVIMNKYNLLEVYYGILREKGETAAERIFDDVMQSEVRIVDGLTDEIFRTAGRLKAKHKISLADAVAIATAMTEDAVLVTSDHHEMDVVEKAEDVEFLWFR